MGTLAPVDLVAELIRSGDLDDHMPEIVEAINDRRDYINKTKLIGVKAGDEIRVSKEVKPRYLAGAVGTVKRVNRKTVMIDFDRVIHGPGGKMWHKNVRVPAALVEQI